MDEDERLEEVLNSDSASTIADMLTHNIGRALKACKTDIWSDLPDLLCCAHLTYPNGSESHIVYDCGDEFFIDFDIGEEGFESVECIDKILIMSLFNNGKFSHSKFELTEENMPDRLSEIIHLLKIQQPIGCDDNGEMFYLFLRKD